MSNNDNVPAIDGQRLRRLFDGINSFGRLPSGGFDRRALTDADIEARRWLAAEMEDTGLEVRWDAAGNVFGRYGRESGAAVMIGSHLDTVPDGGAFDGVLGVCVALESVRALKDAGIMPATPIEVVATSDEEGRFGGMLGSEAIVGKLTREWIDSASDMNGVRLVDALEAQHLNPAAIDDAVRQPGSIKAFLELHVEQGPVLEEAGETIGIVEAVTGICIWQVTLQGVANHAGTTPMDMRSDAFAGLAEIAATIPSIIRIVGSETSRVTIGQVDVLPNHPHTIPGRATFSFVIRDTKEKSMRTMAAAFRALVGRIAKTRGLTAEIREVSWLNPVDLDPGLADVVQEEAKRLGLAFRRMPSGAGHDAQVMQSLCPSALIFAPSRKGISHAPEEATDWADIERAAALYLSVLGRLCELSSVSSITVMESPEPPPSEEERVASEVDNVQAEPPTEKEAVAPALPEAIGEGNGDTARTKADMADKKKMPVADDDIDFDFDLDLDEITISEDDLRR